MARTIQFKEPERCDYLFIDDKNNVHLLMPIVGGDEIGLDNTCKTALELKTFFFGIKVGNEHKGSAEQLLTEYQHNLQKDINCIENSQKYLSKYAFGDLLREKNNAYNKLKNILN